MKDIITRKRIGKNWNRNPIESRIVPKTSREDKRPISKCHKCEITSHLENTCIKKTKINEVQVIEDEEEYDKDYAIYEDTPAEEYPIENITALFQVTEVHNNFPQYSKDNCNLINIQEDRVCKTKSARGKGYTSGEYYITSILMNNS
ncbi:hypothetical protein O181_006791 [Austropuccinia psidii MF-1]|uniref:Uncharacterized protein n=1 Tax=Austropuccinia psidii MF-1 TaxID=1389203 RepID=A0A9Q3BLJ4_9BASI|nr:hypothetical protein [Austropuccinia psidii MF-1]